MIVISNDNFKKLSSELAERVKKRRAGTFVSVITIQSDACRLELLN